jgi:hypothetical protein
MQLGTRWSVGTEPPTRLPEAMRTAIAQVETELTGPDTGAWRWTLTWLEGRPVVELDDGTVLRYDSHTDAVTRSSAD